MKNIKNILKIGVLTALISLLSVSCQKFLERNPQNMIAEVEAIKNADDVVTATMGVYTAMRDIQYYGKTFVAVNDIAADIATKKYQSPPNGWFDNIENYGVNESSTEVGDMWIGMYRTINRAGRVIVAAKELLQGNISSDDKNKINAALAQCYGMKALALFNLVNMYALPYNEATAANELGVVNVADKPIDITDKVTRAKVAENYVQILKDLQAAKDCWALAGKINILTSGSEWMTMNSAAVYAIEARVYLYMGEHRKAIDDVNEVFSLMGDRTIVLDPDEYKLMWTINEASKEDIFTLVMTSAEKTGTTSIGQLYGPPRNTYGARLSPQILSKLQATDIRRSIIEKDSTLDFAQSCYRLAKYNGAINGQVSNIPVVRLPEMYLILAECENELGRVGAAKTALFEVARRDTNITMLHLDTFACVDQAACRTFIQNERARELMLEGHRWMDMRRNELKLYKNYDNSNVEFLDSFDVKKFAYPIPQTEINVTNLQQNDWNNNLPKK